jgi:predicted deacylase
MQRRKKGRNYARIRFGNASDFLRQITCNFSCIRNARDYDSPMIPGVMKQFLSDSPEPSARLFPRNYDSACEQWLAHIRRSPVRPVCREFPHDGQSPGGRPLYTSAAWFGDDSASRVLVLISGTHGIEGFAGTAVLCDMLSRLQTELPDGLAILCVHALNAWGYAWFRRCDADGVDLNRNFIDFSQPLPDNPGYRELRGALFADDHASRKRVLDDYRRRHGQAALEIAISGGQYVDPDGPFYGGTAPSSGRHIIETLIHDFRLAARKLAVIDIHTGLGPFGYGEIICDHPPHSASVMTARDWYGDECTLPALGTSSSVPKLGLLDYAWHAIMQHESCFVTLEFGTLPTDSLFEVLLHDHRYHARAGSEPHANPDDTSLISAMLAHFCPDDNEWQSNVLARAREVIDRAVKGLLK